MTPQETLHDLVLRSPALAAALLDENGEVLASHGRFSWPPASGLDTSLAWARETGHSFLWVPTPSGPMPTSLECHPGPDARQYFLAAQRLTPFRFAARNVATPAYLGIFLSGSATWVQDLKSGQFLWNEATDKLLGTEGAVSSTEDFLRYVHDDDRAVAIAARRRALESDEPVRQSYRIVHPVTGAVRHLCTWRFALRNDQGQALWLLGTAVDITEQVLASVEALDDVTRSVLSETFSSVGFWQWNTQSRVVTLDENAKNLVGLASGTTELSWPEFEQLIHPQDLERVRQTSEALCSGTPAGMLDYRIIQPSSGSVRRMHSFFQRVVTPGSAQALVAGVLFDIGEVLDSQQAVLRHTQRLELAVSGSNIGIFERDLAGGAVTWNAKMFSIFGATPIPGTEAAVLARCLDSSVLASVESMARTHKGSEPFLHEFSCRNMKGESLRLSTRVQVQRDAKGDVTGYYGTALDVTQQTRHADEQRARERAGQASRVKSEMLSRLSHELRTPLNAILGFSKLLEMQKPGPDSGELAQYTRNIQQAGMHLLGLVNDVLELTRLDDEALQPEMLSLDVVELLEKVRSRHQDQADEGGIEMSFSMDFLHALGDEMRTMRILDTLVDNAIRYNRDNGQVHVSASAQGEYVVFEVRDTGLGITSAKRARLFQPLERLGQEASMHPGSGLGLYLSKRLAEKMGGSLDITSTPGKGTTAVFKLPLSGPVEEPAAPARRLRPERLTGTVLYIEDSFMNAMVMQGIFKLSPLVNLIVVKTLEEACAAAMQDPPDLVLVDLLLPDSSGYEVKDALQAQGVPGPFIAVTANALPETRQRALSEGFSEFWTKPLDPQQALTAFSSLLPRIDSSAPETQF